MREGSLPQKLTDDEFENLTSDKSDLRFANDIQCCDVKYYPFLYCWNLEQYRDSRVKLKLWEDEGKVEKEEDEEAEEEEEEDEGTLKVNASSKPIDLVLLLLSDRILKL